MTRKKQLEITAVTRDIILENRGPYEVRIHSATRYFWTSL